MPLAEDSVKAKTLFSVIHSLKNIDFEFDMMMSIGCDLIGNRARLVRQALEAKCTHMLFVDHDMFFPPIKRMNGKYESVITRLLDQDKDIIGAEYKFRSLPVRSTASPLTDLSPKDQPFRCNVVGTGLLLIKMNVFEKLEDPWFNFGRNEKSEMVYGEDAWFCQKAIKAGFEVWADPTLEVKHIGEYLY